MYKEFGLRNQNLTIKEKLQNISWIYIFLIVMMASIGTLMLYSAAGGSWTPWALNHFIRFILGFVIMITIALIDIRYFIKNAYTFFIITCILLIIVDIGGHTGMGATRWIDLKIIKIQPSELIKIAVVLAIAKYFHNSSLQDIESIKGIIAPILMTIIPATLIILQPDLGTAVMIIICAGIMFFIAGVQMWKFFIIIGLGIASLPVIWNLLHDYQQQRVLTFLDPERDPLGAGYHIIQSKIAFGSGGVFGKGFLQGTQSHLSFLPEKHTDFIFTMLAEEFGMIGAVFVICINILILAYGYSFAFKTSGYFGKLTIIGLNTNYFIYIAINIGMVLDLIPVVGIPLPLISYGGTAMLSVMASFGIILSIYINKHINIGKI